MTAAIQRVLDAMAEDPEERRYFDERVQSLYDGCPLDLIADCLLVWAKMAPQDGSYAQTLYVFVNELHKASALASAAQELRAERGNGETKAARDVLAERARQVSAEGWTPEHDDEHTEGELSRAAACFALYQVGPKSSWGDPVRIGGIWPWDNGGPKLNERRQNLVKAGALILAEIERLDRLPPPPVSEDQERT